MREACSSYLRPRIAGPLSADYHFTNGFKLDAGSRAEQRNGVVDIVTLQSNCLLFLRSFSEPVYINTERSRKDMERCTEDVAKK
jgi:hypothetical protein